MLQINSIRGRNSGVFKLFWAGLPAVFIFEVLDLGRELVIDELRDNLMHRFVSPLQPEDRNRRIMMAISCLEQGYVRTHFSDRPSLMHLVLDSPF